MKINIFRTNNIYLEEPQRIGVCTTFDKELRTDVCKINSNKISKELASVTFIKTFFNCCKIESNCLKTTNKRTGPYNLELSCKCCR